MTRALYRALIALHPRSFRTRFGVEMLCTFEDARLSQSVSRLIWDASVSLFRQWLLRESVWKYPAAICGAALMLAIGTRLPGSFDGLHPRPESPSAEFFLIAAVSALFAVSLTTIFCVYWFRLAGRLKFGPMPNPSSRRFRNERDRRASH